MPYSQSTVVLDLVESGVIVLDRDLKIVYWNQFIGKCSLLDLEKHKNMSFFDVFPGIKDSRIEKAIVRAVENNFPSILSHKLIKTKLPLYKKSLATRPPYIIDQSLLIKPIIENNDNRGCIIYIDDVSANAKKERDLRVQSRQLKQLLSKYESVKSEQDLVFDNTNSGIILFDSLGAIEKVNRACETLFNVPVSDFIGRDIAEFLPDIKNKYCHANGDVYEFLASQQDEYEQKFADDPARSLLVTFNPIQEEDGKQGFFVFINDISRIKVAEARLRKANDELEEFAYRTSHDIRSPIVSSRALLQLAHKAIEADKTQRALDCIEQSINSLAKLEQLTIDIMRLTLEDKQEESVEEVPLGQIVEDALENACQLDGFELIHKRIELEHQGPLKSKRIRIQNVVENLISNAIKYHDPSEQQPYLQVRTYNAGNAFYLEVSDNGLGIPEDQRHKVFTMFNRFHPTKSFGSGLGLYLTQKSVHSLGGSITLMDQEKGVGFKLCIPM